MEIIRRHSNADVYIATRIHINKEAFLLFDENFQSKHFDEDAEEIEEKGGAGGGRVRAENAESNKRG